MGRMRATRAVIHLDNFRWNIRLIQSHLAAGLSPGTRRPRICVAVKADAYGHGIDEIARTAVDEGVEYLAVATVDEAVAVRDTGLSVPLLLYSLPCPEEIEEIVRRDITPLVADQGLCSLLSAEGKRQNKRVVVHVKVDTGMGRIGCRPEDAPELAGFIAEDPWLSLEGVSTHFPVADSADRSFTEFQVDSFSRVIAAIRENGVDPGIVHAANSGGLLDYPSAWFDMVRPGILTYGYYPSREQRRPLAVKPVMELESRLVFLKSVPAQTPISYGLTFRTERETRIGTVPVGYGDGYNRLLSNKADVLVEEESGARRVRIAGRVCMDQFMVDLGPRSSTQLYDRVVLFGPDPAGPDAEELADILQTIPYEVTCNISKRVPRIFQDADPGYPADSEVSAVQS